MSNNSHITSHFRISLAAIALFCAAIATMPQAAAQTCGPALTLNAQEWRLVGIPCVPAVANRTIGGVFGPSLGTATYGQTWIAWKRVYDDARCVVAAGPADCYVKLTLASAASTGDAFWIYSTQEKRVQFSSTSGSTPGPYFEFPAKLSTDGNSRYYMFTNPYAATVNWADVTFPANVWGTSFNLSVDLAIIGSIVSKNVHYWNGNTYYTRDLTSPAATFQAKEAAWLEMLEPISIVSPPVNIRVLQP